MSREVVGLAAPDAATGRAPARRPGPDAAPRTAPRPVPPEQRATPPGPPPTTDGAAGPGRRRRAALLLAVALLAGSVAGWDGAGAWRQAQATQVALASTTATAVVVGARDTGPASPAADGAVPGRTATLTVRVRNLGDAALRVFGGGDTFSAVRVRFLEPSGATLAARAGLTLEVAVEVGCASPQVLAVPSLRVVLPDDQSREVRVDAGAPALAALCGSREPGAVPLVEGVAVPARTDVATLLDDGRFRLSMVAPSGRTTRVVGVRTGGIALTGDPLPMTVDGTARALWLDPPAGCAPDAFPTGVPRSVDVDVDAGTGQTATVRLPVGDAFAAWLLASPCGRAVTA